MILEAATVLGGITALWFIWDKVVPWMRRSRKANPTPAAVPPRLARLRIQLPDVLNTVGYIGGAAFTPALNWRVRLIADGDVQPLDVVELGLTEDGVGPWTVDALLLPSARERLDVPIRLNPSSEFWLRARSPCSFEAKPTSVGRLTLWFRDHTQGEGERYEYVVDRPRMG